MRFLNIRRSTAIALLFISFSSLIVRIRLAPTVINGDAVITQGWMESAVKMGVPVSYDAQVNGGLLPAYPPVSLYMFWLSGKLYQFIISHDYTIIQPQHLVFVKLPAIFADVMIGIGLFLLFSRWKRPLTGLVAAALFAIHPAALYNSALWGQTDSIYTCAVLYALIAFVFRWKSVGVVCTIIACFIKPQTASFLPLLLLLFPSTPREMRYAGFWACCTLIVIILPFFMHGNVLSMLRGFHVLDIFGETRLSWNAYNLWWMIFGQQALNIPGGTEITAGISYRGVGIFLYILVVGTTIAVLWKRLRGDLRLPENGYAVFLSASICAAAFFLLNAEMHERYYYPIIVMALPLALLRYRYFLLYLGISASYLLNLLGVFPYSALDRALYATVPSTSNIIAWVHMILFLLLLVTVLRYKKDIAHRLATMK